jgi:hypothetical protein
LFWAQAARADWPLLRKLSSLRSFRQRSLSEATQTGKFAQRSRSILLFPEVSSYGQPEHKKFRATKFLAVELPA